MTTPDLVAALSHRLKESIARDPEATDSLTIGSIYQLHLPYRSIRDDLGLLEFARYEHALLRLLAGEGGHLSVGDQRAHDEISSELASVNPILGIYRDYAEAPVRLTGGDNAPEATDQASPPAPPTPDPSALPGAARIIVPAAASVNRAEPAAAPAKSAASVTPDLTASTPERSSSGERAGPSAELVSPVAEASVNQQGRSECDACGRTLPEGEPIQFCPFCGDEQGPIPCSNCGTELRAEWNFCIRCGTSVIAPRAS